MLVFAVKREGGGGGGNLVTGEKDSAARTGESVALVNIADVVDAAEGEVEDGNLDKAGHGGGDDLGHEHGARRHLHVVAKFEIGNEAKGLRPARIV